MACPEGIEPPTHSLEGCCSIQLSYGQRSREMNGRGERIRTFDPLVPNQMRYQAALRPDFTIVMCRGLVFPSMTPETKHLFLFAPIYYRSHAAWGPATR